MIELLIHQHSQVLLHAAALTPFSIQSVLVDALALLQALAPGLVDLHEVHTGSALKPVPLEVPFPLVC